MRAARTGSHSEYLVMVDQGSAILFLLNHSIRQYCTYNYTSSCFLALLGSRFVFHIGSSFTMGSIRGCLFIDLYSAVRAAYMRTKHQQIR
jgi:hypothetical protein